MWNKSSFAQSGVFEPDHVWKGNKIIKSIAIDVCNLDIRDFCRPKWCDYLWRAEANGGVGAEGVGDGCEEDRE